MDSLTLHTYDSSTHNLKYNSTRKKLQVFLNSSPDDPVKEFGLDSLGDGKGLKLEHNSPNYEITENSDYYANAVPLNIGSASYSSLKVSATDHIGIADLRDCEGKYDSTKRSFAYHIDKGPIWIRLDTPNSVNTLRTYFRYTDSSFNKCTVATYQDEDNSNVVLTVSIPK